MVVRESERGSATTMVLMVMFSLLVVAMVWLKVEANEHRALKEKFDKLERDLVVEERVDELLEVVTRKSVLERALNAEDGILKDSFKEGDTVYDVEWDLDWEKSDELAGNYTFGSGSSGFGFYRIQGRGEEAWLKVTGWEANEDGMYVLGGGDLETLRNYSHWEGNMYLFSNQALELVVRTVGSAEGVMKVKERGKKEWMIQERVEIQ